MRPHNIILSFVLMLLSVPSAFAQGAVTLESTQSVDARVRVAIPYFLAPAGYEQIGQELAQIVGYDLDFSGLFSVVGPAQYPAGFRGLPVSAGEIDFEVWKKTPAEYLVHGVLRLEGGQLVAELRLFDVRFGQQVVGRSIPASQELRRLIGHKFSDKVVEFIDGTPGAATSEIFYTSGETGKKELYVADYDGARARPITKHGTISIKPKVSPDGREIAYVSYKDRFAFIYILNRESGVTRAFSKEPGLNSAPAWSPDGQRIAYVLSRDGNTEIYLKNVDGTGRTRLTDDKGSDSSPTFSSDGNSIAFVSDRQGRPQIMVMGVDGTNPRRISFQGGNSYDPSWSPDGRAIAYVVEAPGEGMEIYMMQADGSNPVRLTDSSGSNESPSWSPDSRHVVFTSTRGGTPALYTVTISTRQVRPVSGLGSGRIEGSNWGRL